MTANSVPTVSAHRGPIAHLLGDPRAMGLERAFEVFDDGLLVVENGRVTALGPYDALRHTLPTDSLADLTIHRHDPDRSLIIPGMVDTHVHMPQLDMIGAYGAQLLDWLNTYTFPTEHKCADKTHADVLAQVFVDQLLAHGTTSALVFATVHAHSADAVFTAARARDMRLVAGKVLMNRHAPDALLDGDDLGEADTIALMERWAGVGRLGYAITPRFAPTSTPAQLAMAGRMLERYPDTLMHTHLSENTGEIAWVSDLFPDCQSYLDVYRQHGLLTDRSVFAHCIHLTDEEHRALQDAGAAIAFCPSSNMFLGSGLFNTQRACDCTIKIGLGSDVGAGTSLSLLKTMGDAYKVAQLGGHALDPVESFYMATLGGAAALNLGDNIGNLAPGKEADFVVLDLHAPTLLSRRLQAQTNARDALFAASILGDDRTIAQTHIAGVCQYAKPTEDTPAPNINTNINTNTNTQRQHNRTPP